MKMGYILISIGMVLVIAGAISLYQTKNKSDIAEQPAVKTHAISPSVQPSIVPATQEIDSKVPQTASDVHGKNNTAKKERFDENERKGREFEEYIVRHFDKDYFTVKEWRSDKGIDGRYAEANTNPDLVMTLHLKKGNYDFAVECKWRSSLSNDRVKISYPEQLDRYRKYAKESRLPVFMVIGIGGKPSDPEAIYCMPLDKIESASLTLDDMKPFYHKQDINFYYDGKTKTLR